MSLLINRLKKYKFFHWFYNLIHYRELLHNKAAYERYELKKPLFGSISSKDFPDKTSRAWLDVGNSTELLPNDKRFINLESAIKPQLLKWSENGYLILRNFFDQLEVESVNREMAFLIEKYHLQPTHDNKFMFANKRSALIRNFTRSKKLIDILSLILDKEVIPFQTLNFIKGSNQRAHSDSIHMTTYPLGYLIAVWIALEDTNAENGPLFYYPGSHKLPYLLNEDFNEGETKLQLGKKGYVDYEDKIEELISGKRFEKKVFEAKMGDVLIWHANLVHGGLPIINEDLTRKSMVIHYYARDVIKYHEITERPSLLAD